MEVTAQPSPTRPTLRLTYGVPSNTVNGINHCMQLGDLGSLLPHMPSGVTWKAGDVVEVAWTLQANHGGGYSYRSAPSAFVSSSTDDCVAVRAQAVSAVVEPDGSLLQAHPPRLRGRVHVQVGRPGREEEVLQRHHRVRRHRSPRFERSLSPIGALRVDVGIRNPSLITHLPTHSPTHSLAC